MLGAQVLDTGTLQLSYFSLQKHLGFTVLMPFQKHPAFTVSNVFLSYKSVLYCCFSLENFYFYLQKGTLSRAFEILFASFSRNFMRQDLVKNLPRKEYLAVAEDWEPVLTDVLVPVFQFVYQVNFLFQGRSCRPYN
jgi:hypothetical protein